MISAEPGRPRTLRRILVYALFGASLGAVIGLAILIMPLMPNVFLRYLAGFVLLVALFFVWGKIATSLLLDADARQLLSKREDR